MGERREARCEQAAASGCGRLSGPLCHDVTYRYSVNSASGIIPGDNITSTLVYKFAEAHARYTYRLQIATDDEPRSD